MHTAALLVNFDMTAVCKKLLNFKSVSSKVEFTINGLSVGMSLSVIFIQDNPNQHKDLSSAFLNILSQVVNRRLPSQFEYHSVPAPWIQIRLLRILALLGADDAK